MGEAAGDRTRPRWLGLADVARMLETLAPERNSGRRAAAGEGGSRLCAMLRGRTQVA